MDKCSDRQRLVSQPAFKEFLELNAPKLYKIILDSILSERHGEKRANLQEKRATALIWQLLYYRYLYNKPNFNADYHNRPRTSTVFSINHIHVLNGFFLFATQEITKQDTIK